LAKYLSQLYLSFDLHLSRTLSDKIASSIFKDAGQTNSDQSGLYVMSVQVVATLASVSLMECLGRRTLLLISSAGMAMAAGLLAVFFVDKASGGSANWLALLSLMLYIVFFSLGMGPVPWLLIGEILPDKIRALAASLGTVLAWGSSFMITETFAYIVQGMQPEGAFLLYGSICAACCVFVFWYLPETKGISKAEIRKLIGDGLEDDYQELAGGIDDEADVN
jgi:nitrate/nitrite transporter NarK